MASFNVRDAENYGGQGGGGFFSLKNNKDVAQVRLLYNGIDDVSGKSVHEIELNGKKRYVNCLREYGDPVDVCPLCKAGSFVQVKYFIPLYVIAIKTNNDNPDRVPPIVTPVDSIMTWERGKKYGSKLTSIMSRYPDTVSHIFEIERNGKAGDQQTTYEIWETGTDEGASIQRSEDSTTLSITADDGTVNNFDIPDPIGTIVLDKSAEEMENFLQTGDFGTQAPIRRESTPIQSNTPTQGGFARRTPASGNPTRKPF